MQLKDWKFSKFLKFRELRRSRELNIEVKMAQKLNIDDQHQCSLIYIDFPKFLFRLFALFDVEIIKLHYGELYCRFYFYTFFYAIFSFKNSIISEKSYFYERFFKNIFFSILLTLNIAEAVSYSFIRSAINFQALHAIDFNYIIHDHSEFFLFMIFVIFLVVFLNILPIYQMKIKTINILYFMNILLFTLFYPFVITIIHDFSRNHKPLKSTDNEEYDNYLKELLFNKTNTSPQVIKYDEKNLKNLILLQLESFPYELVNNRISPNFYNLSQKYEFLAPIKVQPYCSWTTGAVVATQCGIPQILPDSNWEFRRQGKFLYNKNIVCLSDILGSFGYKKIFALTGTESVMGFGEFRKSKNFEKIAQMKNDLKLSCFIAENFLPMMDDDIRGKAHVDIPQKKSRRRRRRRRKVIKNENPVTDNNNKNKTRYLVYIRPEDTHTPYLRPKWCFLNNTHFDSYEKCFNCVDYAINIIIQKYLELKMYEHTLLVVYPDHTPFGASFIKENNHLFILFPGMEKVSDEKKINRSITYYDFAPTILDMIGIKDYLPSYPFGSNIYNINNSETLKHTKPDENDLDVIDNFLNFQPKLINIINSTRMYKCYKRYHQYDTFYYSNKPCNYTSG